MKCELCESETDCITVSLLGDDEIRKGVLVCRSCAPLHTIQCHLCFDLLDSEIEDQPVRLGHETTDYFRFSGQTGVCRECAISRCKQAKEIKSIPKVNETTQSLVICHLVHTTDKAPRRYQKRESMHRAWARNEMQTWVPVYYCKECWDADRADLCDLCGFEHLPYPSGMMKEEKTLLSVHVVSNVCVSKQMIRK